MTAPPFALLFSAVALAAGGTGSATRRERARCGGPGPSGLMVRGEHRRGTHLRDPGGRLALVLGRQ